jgi:DHA2 family multidrug resistance protein-like MFS transporter
MVLGAAPPEKAGAAAALSETSSELGGALGIAILGSIGTMVYRSAIADAFPRGMSSVAREVARGTLGNALSVAHELPAPLGNELVSVARDAFTRGLEVTVVICAIVALVTAVITIILLRRAQAGSGSEQQPQLEPGATASA